MEKRRLLKSKCVSLSLIGGVFQLSDNLCGPSLGPFQQLHIPVLGAPDLPSALQMRPHDLLVRIVQKFIMELEINLYACH